MSLLTTKQKKQRQDFLEELAALMRKYSVSTAPADLFDDDDWEWTFCGPTDERGVMWELDRYDIDDMFIGDDGR